MKIVETKTNTRSLFLIEELLQSIQNQGDERHFTLLKGRLLEGETSFYPQQVIKVVYRTCSSSVQTCSCNYDVTNRTSCSAAHLDSAPTDLSWSAEGGTGCTASALAFLSACNSFSPCERLRREVWMTEAGGHGGGSK